MPSIDPTAIVHPVAELADDVTVGPHCVVGEGVRVGAGTRLLGHVYLQGPLTLGRRNTLYPFTCLGFAPQAKSYDHDAPGAGTVVGDGNTFREGTTIHRATRDRPTTVGDNNYFMTNSHAGHDARVGDRCMLATGAMIGGHVELAEGVILGGGSAVHQFARLGRLSMLSGVTAAKGDVPPFCMLSYGSREVTGLNVVGLRRAGLTAHIRPLFAAVGLMLTARLPNRALADRIESELGGDPLCLEVAAFIRSATRELALKRSALARAQAGNGARAGVEEPADVLGQGQTDSSGS